GSVFYLSSLRLQELPHAVPPCSGWDGSSGCSLLRLAPVLLPSKQFPVDVGDLLQVLLDSMVVLDPTPHLHHLVGGHGSPAAVRLIQGHTQIPHRAVPLPPRAFARWVPARQVTLH